MRYGESRSSDVFFAKSSLVFVTGTALEEGPTVFRVESVQTPGRYWPTLGLD